MTLNSPLTSVKGVGEELAKKLKVVGIETAGQLIDYWPRTYEDFSTVTPIARLKPGRVTIQATIKQAKGRYLRRGMHLTEAVASDAAASVRLVWFNQPYRAASFKAGADYYISGQFELSRQRLQIMNPSVELVSEFPVSTARIVPGYRAIKGVTAAQLRRLLRELLPLVRTLPETLPPSTMRSYQLMSRADAIESIHFPKSSEDLAAAHWRLGFEEVFELSLASLLNKQEIKGEASLIIPFKQQLARDFVRHVPFALTDAQRKVIWQIYKDMDGSLQRSRLDATQGSQEERAKRRSATMSERLTPADATVRQEPAGVLSSAGYQGQALRAVQPMNRLVEGDVGSGKTVVAAMAALMPLAQGYQVAFMAPTELLARQHAETIYNLLKPISQSDTVVLLVGGLKPAEKAKAQQAIKQNRAKFIIGTHALIQEKVDIQQLALVIIDEQHRFGVEQRKALMAKAGHMPHVLSLTATPIPRTLALTLYGEMDIAVLDAKPQNRRPIITKIVSPNSRAQLYERIKEQLRAGRQIFVVCPLISESSVSDSGSAEHVHEQLAKRDFKEFRVGLLHGKMKTDEKNRVMGQFVAHELDILVATTVIEVGVDVPNASVMLIENAERFGLAQIHQLRGRVGRGEHQGYCYLMLSDSSPPTARLRALENTTDGFELAELDLELRGPGAIYGRLQHGPLDLRIAELSNAKLIAAARAAAEVFINSRENLLQYPELANHVQRFRAVTNLN